MGKAQIGSLILVAALGIGLAGCEGGEKAAGPALTSAASAALTEKYGKELGGYLSVRTALAADDGAAAKAAAKDAVAAAPEEWKKPLQAIADSADLKAARGAFHDLSKLAIAQAAKVKKAGSPALVEFQCPMAPPYGHWLQESEPLANPYWGSGMLRCGTKVGTVGGS